MRPRRLVPTAARRPVPGRAAVPRFQLSGGVNGRELRARGTFSLELEKLLPEIQ